MTHERPATKVCSTCKEAKTYDNFHKDKRQIDGHDRRCKACISLKSKKYADKNRSLSAKQSKDKKCSMCGALKQPSEFYKDKTRIDGLDSRCKACGIVKAEIYREENKDKIAFARHRDRDMNNAKAKEKYYLFHDKSKARARKQSADYVTRNPDKAKQSVNNYRVNRRSNWLIAQTKAENKRRALKIQSESLYVFDKEYYDFFMDEIYRHSQLLNEITGIAHEVDHIVPLKGKLVTGLHIPVNLQILTRSENRAKSNKLVDDIV